MALLPQHTIATLINNLKQLDYVPSIILISHDRDVVREADSVYLLKNGTLESVLKPAGLLILRARSARKINNLLGFKTDS